MDGLNYLHSLKMDLNLNNNQTTFLGKVAESLLANHPEQLQNVRVIFPNRRAKLFLEKELQKRISKPIWLPKIEGFDDFLQDVFKLNYSSDLEVKMHLFNCYQNVYQKNDSLEDFLKWSAIILSDFNDILESEVNFKTLLTHLEKIRILENWNPTDGNPTPLQSEYFSFWKKLPLLFEEFVKPFEKSELFARSYAEKKLAANFNDIFNEKLSSYKHYYFIGFNALTASEQKIFSQFKNQTNTHFYWDVDEYYFNNQFHEAGKPIKAAAKALKEQNISFLGNQLTQKPKKINIVGAQGNYNQTKILSSLLSNLSLEEQKETAVVLGNTANLPQLLNSLPENIKTVNISAGLSIQSQPLYSLFFDLIKLWKNQSKKTAQFISYSSLKILLYNDYLKKCVPQYVINQIAEYVVSKNLIYLTSSTLKALLDELKLPHPLDGVFEFIEKLISNKLTFQDLASLLNVLEQTEQQIDVFDKATYEVLSAGRKDLEFQFQRFSIKPTAENTLALFKYLVQPQELNFLGEPLEGLQIIGLLETRNINFKNVLISSVNEGVFPKAKNQESLIPYDVRKAFNLPTHELKDGIFSYHFYRLIQGAEKVHLIYNTSSDKLGKGEKSRFIQQIETEKELSKFIETNTIYTPQISVNLEEPQKVKVDRDKLLHFLTDRGLSPSALNTYLENPLEFYYRYVENIYEAKELEETLDAATLGDIIHKVLEELYESNIDKHLNDIDFNDFLKIATERVNQLFMEKVGSEHILPGKNLILNEVSKKVLENTLLHDKQTKGLMILGVEENIKTTLDVDSNKVIIKGLIDRIDQVNGKTRIVDYKTGKVESKDLKIENLNRLLEKPSKPKAMQLFFYAYLISKHKNYASHFPVSSGILSLRTISKGLLPLEIGGNNSITKETLLDFEIILTQIIRNMLESEYFVENLNFEYQPFYHF